MAAKMMGKELLPAMDSVMPGAGCLTSFAKKKVAMEMQRKFMQQQKRQSRDEATAILHPVPVETGHRRRVDECRAGLSYDRQPARCVVMVIQNFKPRTNDEVSVDRGEHVKLLFIEEDWAYICKKSQPTSTTSNGSKKSKKKMKQQQQRQPQPEDQENEQVNVGDWTGQVPGNDVMFGYIPQAYCRPLTESELRQKHSRRSQAAALGMRRRSQQHQRKIPDYSVSSASTDATEAGAGATDRSGGVSPTPTAYVNPYLQMDILPSDDDCLDEDDEAENENEDATGSHDNYQYADESCYSFRTLETTSQQSHSNRHLQVHREKSCDSSSSSCQSDDCMSVHTYGTVITFPGMVGTPTHRHYHDDDNDIDDDVSRGVDVAMATSGYLQYDVEPTNQDQFDDEPLPPAPLPEELEVPSSGNSSINGNHEKQHLPLEGSQSLISSGSQISLPYPAKALFDFHGDSTEDTSSSGEQHLSVRKGQLLTVVDFARTSGDWVVAYTDDGRQGILPFCFAQYCDPFPGYPFVDMATSPQQQQQQQEHRQGSDESLQRPGTDLRRLDSQKRFYSDATSFTSEGSSGYCPAFGREAPDGQSIDLQRMHSGASTSSGYQKHYSMTLSHHHHTSSSAVSSGTSLRRNSVSSSCIMHSLPSPPHETAPCLHDNRHMTKPAVMTEEQQHGRIAPAPSMNFVHQLEEDHYRSTGIPLQDDDVIGEPAVMSSGDKRPIPAPRKMSAKTATGSSSSGNISIGSMSVMQTGSMVIGPRTDGARSQSSSNLQCAQTDGSYLDLRVGLLSKGMSDGNLRTCMSSPRQQPRLPNQQTAKQGSTKSTSSSDQYDSGNKLVSPVEYSRSTSMPQHALTFNPDRRQSTPDAYLARPRNEGTSSGNLHGNLGMRRTPHQQVQISPSRRQCSKPPFMSSISDVSTTTMAPPSSHSSTLPRQHPRQERIQSHDSAIGGSSSEDLLEESVLRTTSSTLRSSSSSSSLPRPINTQLVVKKKFNAKGDNQLSVVAGEVVVVADERDHKDWLWVFAPMQRAFGFVPAVFTLERQ